MAFAGGVSLTLARNLASLVPHMHPRLPTKASFKVMVGTTP